MKTRILLLALCCSVVASAQQNLSALLPLPNHIEQQTQQASFALPETPTVYTNSSQLDFETAALRNVIKERLGLSLAKGTAGDASFRLLIDPAVKGKEGYIVEVTEKGVTIQASEPAGIYYGVMTLDQLLLGDVCHSQQYAIAAIRIEDTPRYPYRALMLDPARHFLPLKDVKFFIDQMARYKYNVLQLHLTDDQGWRVEIKKYPRLTEIGAVRNKDSGMDGPENGFYTQEQLKELIVYASQRHIEIVPELDIPGHTVAVLAAYPELGCTHTDTIRKVMGKTLDLMLCSNRPQVYDMYRDIIHEISILFPSPRIHLGGDEAVIEKNWSKCSRCQSLMKQLGYTKPSQLMNHFFEKMLSFVRENGKEPVLWCELNNIYPPADDYLFDYPKDVTLVTWRGGLTPTCIDLTARRGNRLIMAPGEFTYLDYPQMKNDLPEFNNWGMPVTTLEQCYRFDPGYGLPAAKQSHILGIMGTLWGEAIKDINRVTYMTYPRGLALAEAGWTEMPSRDWESFKTRMYPNLSDLMKRGVSIRVPFEVVKR